jgi:hypothetical protein
MSGSSKKSLKAALALGGGLVTVGLMAAMMNDDDGPPADVVDGVQSTMNGLVDKAGGAVAAMAASVGEAVKSSLGGVLKTAAPPAKKKKKTKTKAAAKARKARKAAKKAAAAPVTPPKKTAPARDEPVVPEAAPPTHAFAAGARVEALWAGTWYGAVVEELHADGSYEIEWTDTPDVFNTVAAADVRALSDDVAPAAATTEAEAEEPAPAAEEAALAAEPAEEEAPAPPAPADDEGEEEPEEEQEPEAAPTPEEEEEPAAAAADDEVQGLLDGAAPRVVVDMLLANESFKIAFAQDNPKRPDSASYERYEAYKAATCGDQVLELGGSKSDVLHDYKKGFLRVTRCPAMIAYDLDRDAVAEPVSGRPARRAPKRELFVAESATVDNKKLKGAE